MHMRNRWLATAAVAALGSLAMGASLATCQGYVAHLSGASEVDPVDTAATGQALFLYSEVSAPSDAIPPGVPSGGPLAGRAPTQIDFRLQVSRTDAVAETGDAGQVLAAHLHCAAAGANGPIAVTLFDANGTGVATPARLAGALTDASIGTNDCGIASLADLVGLLESGNAYVNVHTNAHPGGEIRGQIRALQGP